MVKFLLILFAGIGLGMLLRNKQKIIAVNNKSTLWVIFVLLFFMGISVGNNPDIMNNLDTIGLRGLQFAFVGVLGSAVLAWLVYVLFFKNGTPKRNKYKNESD